MLVGLIEEKNMRVRLKEEPEKMDMKIDESAELLANNNEDPNEKVNLK